jgi:photosystem II stability/assembly factor-like uncharacterized protein
VWFVDSVNGWACGDSGIILRTTNSGRQWLRQQSGTRVLLEEVFFWDNLLGWAVGDSGTILYTSNGGNTWMFQTSSVSTRLTHIRFHSSGRGWATGARLTRLRTTDWGNNWSGTAGDSTTPDIDSEYWIDDAAAGRSYSGGFQYTATGGAVWCIGFVPSPDVYADMIGQRIGGIPTYWLVGNTGTLNRVAKVVVAACPGGAGIRFSSTDDSLSLNDIHIFNSPLTMFAVGNNGKVVSSVDSGTTWIRVDRPTTASLNSVFAFGARESVVIGDSGQIFRRQTATEVRHKSESTGRKLFPLQPFPNPFNSNVVVELSLTKHEHVRIQVIDLLGRIIMNVTDGTIEEGYQTFNIDFSLIPSGVFFLIVHTPTAIQVERLVHLK